MNQSKIVIVWFRRDLRLSDHLALEAASQQPAEILPVFCLDPALLESEHTQSPRLAFMLQGLASLDHSLRQRGSRLAILRGKPKKVLAELIERVGASALFFNADYTPYARHRDETIVKALPIPVHRFDDALLHAPGEVLKANGEPYVVFTPFKRQWLTLTRRIVAEDYLEKARFYAVPEDIGQPIPTLAELNFRSASIEFPPVGEQAAQQRLQDFMQQNIYLYGESRNRLVAEPWRDTRSASSYLSPYFRFGMISPRQVYWAARDAYTRATQKSAKASVEAFVNELIWREFYMHIMYFYPHVTTRSFRTEYDDIEWADDPNGLQAWKDGITGYPIIDAAMRQLKAIGWMPNRARMIVASFLTKDLLIDWREGEKHFMQCLIDGDPAANNGGWQWAAGTGTDAQPYFRIFNPVSQSKKFDPEGEYIRFWVPELADLPLKFIHEPWKAPTLPKDYPPPIVDHQKARQRTLEAYKAIKS